MVLQQVVGLELDLTHMKLLQRVMRKVQQVQQPKPPGTEIRVEVEFEINYLRQQRLKNKRTVNMLPFHHTVPAIGHTGFAIAAIAASSPVDDDIGK